MGEMGVWVEKEKTLLQKKELNPEIWGKGVCDIWEKWVCLGGEIQASAPKKELDSEIWGKGVCDIWEKWAPAGGTRIPPALRANPIASALRGAP